MTEMEMEFFTNLEARETLAQIEEEYSQSTLHEKTKTDEYRSSQAENISSRKHRKSSAKKTKKIESKEGSQSESSRSPGPSVNCTPKSIMMRKRRRDRKRDSSLQETAQDLVVVPKLIKIYLVPHGKNISKAQIRAWQNAIEKKTFLDLSLNAPSNCSGDCKYGSVVVVDSSISAEKLGQWCGLKSPTWDKINGKLKFHHVVPFTWLISALQMKSMEQVHSTLSSTSTFKSSFLERKEDEIKECKKESKNVAFLNNKKIIDNNSSGRIKKSEPNKGAAAKVLENCPWLKLALPSSTANVPSAKIRKERTWFPDRDMFACQISGTDAATQSDNYNKLITDQLEPLVDIYQILGDKWRQYSYKKAVGIIKNLPYAVEDEDQIKSLKKIRGLGAQMVAKIEEIVNQGYLARLVELRSQPRVAGMLEFSKVWGVGPTKAERLYNLGFRKLEDLKTPAGQQALTRQQKIGLARYEDLLERIPRAEVEAIEAFVKREAQVLFPDLHGTACGSYRRGKQSMGDVDIIFCPGDVQGCAEDGTPPGRAAAAAAPGDGAEEEEEFPEEGVSASMSQQQLLPGDLLTPVVERLAEVGFLTDHLQMPGTFDPEGHQTYMGVCKLPDWEGAKHRRLDLKVYSRQQYPFAILYFTGSDHFNRSMRLYAKHLGLSLSDEGLCPATRVKGQKVWTGDSIHCESERDVFDALGLQYRAPNQRNCFDVRFIEDDEKNSAKPSLEEKEGDHEV